MESLKPQQRHFDPRVTKTIFVSRDIGFRFEGVFYHKEQNRIVVSFWDKSVQLLNSTSHFKPLKSMQELDSAATKVTSWPQSKICLFGCESGNIYAHNLSNNIVQRVHTHVKNVENVKNIQNVKNHIGSMAFISVNQYIFSRYSSNQMYIGRLKDADEEKEEEGDEEEEILLQFSGEKSNVYSLHSSPNSNLLFSTHDNGYVKMYRTDRLPKLPNLYSIQTSQFKLVTQVEKIRINEKEYIITTGFDGKIRIWNLAKGKMRLLKMIHVEEAAFWMVYLSKYKMLATSHNAHYISFFRLPSGKLERTLDLGMGKCFHIFLMEDKNAIGVASLSEKKIKIVKLSR